MFIHQLFEKIVFQNASSNALEMNDRAISRTMSYEELNRHANQIAHYLIENGVKPNDVVGVSCRRSFEMVATILGILKAGAGYLPLDPDYPTARLNYMLEHSRAKILLTQDSLKHLFVEKHSAILNTFEQINFSKFNRDNPKLELAENNLAYVIYTSGSTGTPKGVAMGHKALVNLLHWQNSDTSLKNDSRTLQFTPISFDVHFQEIFSTLSLGGTLILLTEDERLDTLKLLKIIEEKKVNRLYLPYVALNHMAEIAGKFNLYPQALKEITTAGEQLKITPAMRFFFEHLNKGIKLFNHYGPTETHVVTSFMLDGAIDKWPDLPSIGKNISNVECLILDKNFSLAKEGYEGELYVRGEALANGYLHSPDLTLERFIEHKTFGRIYKTGDLVKRESDQTITYLGRVDSQVKIRGYRIEIGEIEVAIQKAIHGKSAVVKVIRPEGREAYLCAYLKEADLVDVKKLKSDLKRVLPDYMLPGFYLKLVDFPLTPSGKVDYKNLPAPSGERPELQNEYVSPTTLLEKQIHTIWKNFLFIDEMGVDDSFFDLGGTSLLAIKILIELNQEFQGSISIAEIFQYPTIRSFAKNLELKQTDHKYDFAKKETSKSQDIAVIAMTGRFPGAKSVEELWDNLLNQKNGLKLFNKNELSPYVSSEMANDPSYVFAEGEFPEQKTFDSKFFGMTPREAELMDPQQRKFLELCHEALELAGYNPDEIKQSIGIFAGMGNSKYQRLVDEHPEKINQVGEFNVMLGLEKDYIATRVAFKLNLKGPALSIHTGCSTSLVAIIEACQSLRLGQSDMALAGGISISGNPKTGHQFIEGGILSQDGTCRPFDEKATGTVFSDGAGVVVLKRLEDAKRDRDQILAVVKGVGLNNDGANKMSFTAPSVEGQLDAIVRAQIDGDIHPETIGYVEAHGTATPIGDPIEVDALAKAFRLRTEEKKYCVLSSIKANLGHLTAAAGVTGFIKTVLTLNKGVIPGTLHFEKANPLIHFDETPFVVTNKNTEFKAINGIKRAAISSFGVGGTNSHVILEEYQTPAEEKNRIDESYKIFKVSAKTKEQLDLMKKNLVGFLEKTPLQDFEKIAYTLDVGRKDFKFKSALIVRSKEELATNAKFFVEETPADKKATLVFTFPGQGSHYHHMGRELYEQNLIYHTIFDYTIKTINQYIDYDLKEIIFAENSDELLTNTYYSQPAIFALQYSLAQTLITLGIRPDALIGHSIGEYAAAAISGIFSLEDAAHAITKRALLVSSMETGKMISISDSQENVKKYIVRFDLDIAAINGRKSVVVAGAHGEVHKLKNYLDEEGIASIELKTSHAFHSRMMDAMIEEYSMFMRGISFKEGSIPLISSVEGKKDSSLATAEYWGNHVRETVHFVGAVEAAIQKFANCLFLEVGTKNITSNLIKKELVHLKNASKVITALEDKAEKEDFALKRAIAALWMNGFNYSNKEAMYLEENRSRVPAPTYIFEKNEFWLNSKRKEKIMSHDNLNQLEKRLGQIFEDASGIDVTSFDKTTTFLEMGMDSLFLTQVSMKLKKDLKVNITFRQLLEDYSSIETLAIHLEGILPKEKMEVKAAPTPAQDVLKRKVTEDRPIEKIEIQSMPVQMTREAVPTPLVSLSSLSETMPAIGMSHLDDIIKKQLEIMNNQLHLLSGRRIEVRENNVEARMMHPAQVAATVAEKRQETSIAQVQTAPKEEIKKSKESFGAQARIVVEKNVKLDEATQKRILEFQGKYNEKTKLSKKFAQDNRKNHSDPRVVTGFKPESKEFVYPIVVKKSYLQSLWDLDNNRYVDMTCGFGSNFFGNGNERIKKYVLKQIEEGIELGPQHPLVSEVSKLINELTGNERTAFCNTGSEAVLGAMRVARTVTGREKIICFTGSYHGINDEVILRAAKNLTSYPAAAGINNEAVSNMIVLDYGTDEALEYIRQHSHEVAAVLVEPVQSRRSDFHPKEFLKEVRKITLETETCLIFDEIITGFRVHPAGAQGYFGIRADLCTYGKIVGGGMPIGVVSGKTAFMDALDGGFWQFGDESTPTVGVTYFAGTFVRHPLALAAALGALEILKEGGEKQLNDLNNRAQKFADELNLILKIHGIPLKIDNFGSLMKPKWKEELPGGDLFFAALRYNGVHVYDGFPWFVNLAHTKEDLDQVIDAFKKSVLMMEEMGVFRWGHSSDKKSKISANIDMDILDKKGPPVVGARIGKDENGNPAWFIEDEKNPGQYLQVKVK